ncbi:MAG: response regulator transcription factor [Candidatus Kapabacteria bacterium]|nr:response regulator transcription factor [Candidatus Kapabacteria bacterium]
MSIYTEKNPIKILIADDHEILRAGLRKVISVAQNMDIIAEAEDGLQAIKLAEQYQPTVVLLDILMPKLTGIEAVPKIKQVCPYTFIIIFTAFEDINHIEKALKVEADGYISKGVSPQFLIEALNNVVMGQKVYSKSIIKIIRDGIITNYSQTEEKVNLTQKEKEILHYLADGCSSREIAKKLNISVRTVETHRYNLMNKLELTNAAQLIRFAILHTDN